ncbi:MAG: sigma-54-dependent Fis family transcriptional regulator [Rhodocyclales bacterium]|nr:sigma-54-dependent Fis family transcriptional regulator [Rhodocyclales bacterium]
MHVLVIDDELALRQIIAATVRRAGYSVDSASGVKEAAAKLVRGDFDVAICDIRMQDGDGVELVRSMKGSGIPTLFIMVTAFASVQTAVEALRAGAMDYMVKPVDSEELLYRLRQAQTLLGLKAENVALRKFVSAERENTRFKFSSAPMLAVERLAGRVAAIDNTVLVTGESGTGKGVLARLIHDQSARAEAPFIPVNCSAIPENLLESELFGHTKGAFTGASQARKGLFAQADSGTLFLDEIGELPLHMQTKMLHVIEDKEIRPVGSEQLRKVDTRIIVATNRDLPAMIAAGTFREDLYFRISQFHIDLPPLRERGDDLLRLIGFFLDAAKIKGASDIELDPAAEELLLEYRWPGNLRELENVIGRALIMADGGRITIADLPPGLSARSNTLAQEPRSAAAGGSLREQVRRAEADIIFRVLKECGGDRKAAASQLEIGLSSLYRKLDEFEAMGMN